MLSSTLNHGHREEGMMFWFKSCPKCGGDLCTNHDQYGPFISCVQCGYYLDEAEQVVLRYASTTLGKVDRVRGTELVEAGGRR